MDELIKTFHIDYKLLIAQIINFAIVVFVLYRFAYKPLLKTMNDRTSVIEKGLDDAKQAQLQLEDAQKMREEKINEAKKEARNILDEAQLMAEKNKQDMILQAKNESQKVVEQARKQIQSEKEMIFKQVQQEIGGLVTLAVEKVIDEKINDGKDKKIINDAIENI